MERITPKETVRSIFEIAKMLGAEALAAIDRKLDWQPNDSPEDAAIPSSIVNRIVVTHVESPAQNEDELNQYYLW